VTLVNIYVGMLRDKRIIFNLDGKELDGPTYRIVGKDIIIDLVIKDKDIPPPPPKEPTPKPPTVDPGEGSTPIDKPTQASI
jgi:hypothetical protein